jgi:hypothetical protein
MTIAESLDVLNLSKSFDVFAKNQVYHVNELHLHLVIHDKSKFNDNYRFKNKLDEQRIKLMISGESEDKADHQFLTPEQANGKIQKFDLSTSS